MIQITARDYFKIPKDYKGVYEDIPGDRPEWKGKRMVFEGCITHEPSTRLLIEGVHFEITGSYKPSNYELSQLTK